MDRIARALRSVLLVSAALALSAPTAAALAAPLTLQQAMTDALAANPGLRSRQADVETQQLEKDIARGRRLPRVDLQAGYTHHAYPSLVTPIRRAGEFPPLDRDVTSVGVALALPLYAGGRLVAGESLAAHGHDAAVHALRGAGQDLLFDVVATYAKALHLRDLQSSANARIRTLECEESHLSQRLHEGRVARLELVRLQTQLSQARHDLLSIAQAERDARSLLATLLGSGSNALAPLADTVPAALAVPGDVAQAQARALATRPALLRVQALRNAASDRVEIARGEQRARVDLVARAQENAGGDWKSYDDAQIGIQLNIPLFDGAIRRNRVAQAEIERRSSDAQIEQQRNELSAEIEQAWGAVAESGARRAVAAQAESEGEEAHRIETARYEAGESTITDLLAAEAALWNARVSRMQAGYDTSVSQARLLRAIGELSPQSFTGENR